MNSGKAEKQPRDARRELLVPLYRAELKTAGENGEPLSNVFMHVSEQSGLKFTTVRNYYYRYMREDAGLEHLSPGFHGASQRDNAFSSKEIKELMVYILTSLYEGKSVRRCAFDLAKGDKNELLRYQNKYRAMIVRYSEYVLDLMRELWDANINFYNPYTKEKVNIASFPKDYDFGSPQYRKVLEAEKTKQREQNKVLFTQKILAILDDMTATDTETERLLRQFTEDFIALSSLVISAQRKTRNFEEMKALNTELLAACSAAPSEIKSAVKSIEYKLKAID